MYRTHTCGSLRVENVNERVTLAGWVQKVRNLGAMTFIDLRDRYGITQIVVEEHSPAQAREAASRLGREFVVQVTGRVVERSSKNPKMPTGDIEVAAEQVNILNEALTPPFTIEEVSDGGDDLRMKYRYLDLRRPPLQRNLILRHKMAQEIRRFLDAEGFLEIETPYLVGSTPEGARDFVVPSRMNPNQFYALPQSPQTLKQLLMVAGYDKYFQIVRCFRDEDLRADRQPEFTQIDCEMSFVEQEDILEVFERWAKHMFHAVMGIDFTEPFRRMPWIEAMEKYGSDKPDLRFGMEFSDLTELAKGHGFSVFDNAEYVTGFAATGCATYTRKQIDALTEYVKRPQVGAKGLIWLRVEESGIKSSIRVGRGDAALLCDAPPLHLAQARGLRVPRERPRPRTRQRLRLRLQRHRNRRRLDSYPRRQAPGPHLQVPGLYARACAGAVRLPDERLQVRCTPSRRSGLRLRPALLTLRRLGLHPRLHRLPEEQRRPRRDARRTVVPRPVAA